MPEMIPDDSERRIAFSFPARVESISEVRRLIIGEARSLPFTEDQLDDIELAVSEIFTNLVQYTPDYRIRGTCTIHADALEVTFDVEQGLNGVIERRAFPTGLSVGGRGIPLLNLLIPMVEIHPKSDGGEQLRMVKPVAVSEEHR